MALSPPGVWWWDVRRRVRCLVGRAASAIGYRRGIEAVMAAGSGQGDLEVWALIIVDDPRRAGPGGEVAGTRAGRDVAEPGAGVRRVAAVLYLLRALSPVVGPAADPFRGQI